VIRFSGLIAPTEVPTGDGRMFASGKMTHRPLPIPMMARFGSGGHDGAVPVGVINRIYQGPGGYWCEGEFLDPTIVPEVTKAIYMLSKKAMGPSVDLDRDFTVESVPHPTRPDKKAGKFNEYNVIGVTLVPMPAFHQVHMSVDSPTEQALLASAGVDTSEWETFDVNAGSWRNWPIAPREYKFDADDAVKRIAYWAGIGSKEPSLDQYASTFLWRNGNQAGDTMAQDSFRLPIADIINGEPHLIYHAVYSAAALLSGAHGGVPNIPDADKPHLIRTINEIYSNLASVFNDKRLKSPFLVGVRPEEMAIGAEEEALDSSDCGCENVQNEMSSFQGSDPQNGTVATMPQTITINAGDQTYTVAGADGPVQITFNHPMMGGGPMGGPMMMGPIPVDVLRSMKEEEEPYGDDGCHFDSDGFCMTHFAEMEKKPYGDVLYADPGYQSDGKHRYPIDRPAHVRAAWAYINMPKNARKYTGHQLDMIKERIREAAKKYGIEISQVDTNYEDRVRDDDMMVSLGAQSEKAATLLAGAAPLAPPAAWFATPNLDGPTKLTIGEDGRVFGHLATWRVCHVGVGNACVLAPKSRMNYGLFRVGTLVCDDGTQVPVGKITLGTGHANAQWGVMPSREHYDNTGWAAAVVNVGEDRHGIWVSGALTSTMTPERVAEFRAAALSGDWREVNGNLELIAALAVNNPGFPIYRESGGRAFSLMAVGVIGSDEEISGEFSMDETDGTEDATVVEQTEDSPSPSPELAARLEALDQDWEQHQRAKRFAQLASLDADREKVDAPSARSRFRFDQQYEGEWTRVNESDGDDEE
jgi:hypothetical protein